MSGTIAGILIILTILTVVAVVLRRRSRSNLCRRSHGQGTDKSSSDQSVAPTELLEFSDSCGVHEDDTVSSMGTNTTPTSIVDHTSNISAGNIVGYESGSGGRSLVGYGPSGTILGSNCERVLLSTESQLFNVDDRKAADGDEGTPPDILEQEFPPPKEV